MMGAHSAHLTPLQLWRQIRFADGVRQCGVPATNFHKFAGDTPLVWAVIATGASWIAKPLLILKGIPACSASLQRV